MAERVQLTTKTSEAKRENSASKTQKIKSLQAVSSPVDQVLYLQRTIGNQAVQRLIKSGALQAKLKIGQPGDRYEQEADRVAEQVIRMPEPGVQRQSIEEEEKEQVQTRPVIEQITPLVQRQGEEEQVQTKPITEQITPLIQRQVEEEKEEQIQTKPVTGHITPLVQKQVEEEKEEQVQTKPITGHITPLVQRQVEEEEEQVQTKPVTAQITPLVQRQVEEGGEEEELHRQPIEEEEEELQAKTTSGIPEVRPDIESDIQSLKGGGEPLSESDRAFYEPRFGHDFSGVRVHTGTQAGEMAKGINAKAFTIGKNVVFGSGQYSPKTDEGKKLLAHELTHVIHQQSAALRIQQKTDKYILEPVRQNAEACLIHIHGNEKGALSAAQKLYAKFCVNFMHIDSGRRHVKVDIPGKNFSCKADPNRIFDKAAISDGKYWNFWNWNYKKFEKNKKKNKEWNLKNNQCLISKNEAQKAVETYAKTEMEPKIDQCRASKSGKVISGKIPVVVFHNNTDYDKKETKQRKKDLTIESYLPTGIYKDATETDENKDPLKSAIQELKNNPGKSNPKAPQTPPNPHRQDGEDKDDFILVTKGKDFVDLVRRGLNVVLQKQNITDDGSLSVALSSERYLNIEAQIGSKKQLGIGKEVLEKVMGISSIPCPKIQPSSTGSPTVNIQFKTFPEKVSNQKERIKYLLGQFDPKKLGFKKVKIMKKYGYLRPEAAIAFEKMKKAAKKNNITLNLVSATRTFEDQKNIWNKKMVFDKSRKTFGRFEAEKSPVSKKCGAILTENDLKLKEWDTRNTNHRKCWNKLNDEDKSLEILKTSSAPGTSRHHWGTDIDLNSINPEDWEKTPLKEVHAWLTKNANTYGFYQAYTPVSERGSKGYYEEKWHWSYRPIAEPLLKEYIKLFKDPKEFEKALKGKGVKASPFIISKYMEYASSVGILLKLSDKELEIIENILKSIGAFLRSIRFPF